MRTEKKIPTNLYPSHHRFEEKLLPFELCHFRNSCPGVSSLYQSRCANHPVCSLAQPPDLLGGEAALLSKLSLFSLFLIRRLAEHECPASFLRGCFCLTPAECCFAPLIDHLIRHQRNSLSSCFSLLAVVQLGSRAWQPVFLKKKKALQKEKESKNALRCRKRTQVSVTELWADKESLSQLLRACFLKVLHIKLRLCKMFLHIFLYLKDLYSVVL